MYIYIQSIIQNRQSLSFNLSVDQLSIFSFICQCQYFKVLYICVDIYCICVYFGLALSLYMYIYIFVYVCIYIYMYIYIYIHIYTYIYIYSKRPRLYRTAIKYGLFYRIWAFYRRGPVILVLVFGGAGSLRQINLPALYIYICIYIYMYIHT